MGKAIKLTGKLTVGQGMVRQLSHAKVVRPYGNQEIVEVHLSAADKTIWLQLSREEAAALAEQLAPAGRPLIEVLFDDEA